MKKQILVSMVISVLFVYTGGSMAAGNIKSGKVKAATCKTCHGSAGEGKTAPRLAGLDEAHIIKQLQDFKSGARKSSMMNMFAGSLDHMDIADLAAYYSSLK
jgi:cytochrome c553